MMCHNKGCVFTKGHECLCICMNELKSWEMVVYYQSLEGSGHTEVKVVAPDQDAALICATRMFKGSKYMLLDDPQFTKRPKAL